MVRVIWSRRSIDDLTAIRGYIGQFNPIAAQRIADRLVSAGYSLAEHPSRGGKGRQGRRALAIVPPYLIHYRLIGEEVEIITVRHGARRRLR